MAQILVVDDEPAACRALARLLRAEGHDAISIFSGTDALSSLQSQVPDLMILDLMMPPPDGIEVLLTMRKTEELRSVAVVAFTASADRELCRRALDCGARDCVRKGTPWPELWPQFSRHL